MCSVGAEREEEGGGRTGRWRELGGGRQRVVGAARLSESRYIRKYKSIQDSAEERCLACR